MLLLKVIPLLLSQRNTVSKKKKILRQNEITDASSLQKGEEIIIRVRKRHSQNWFNLHASHLVPIHLFQGRNSIGNRNVWTASPTKGQYTQYFHYGHYAVDIANSGGSPIWAADGGTVERAASGWNGGYGNVVVIDHGNGMKTLYAHLKEIYVTVGQDVARGTPLATWGILDVSMDVQESISISKS